METGERPTPGDRGLFGWRLRAAQAILLLVPAFFLAVGCDALSGYREQAGPVRCNGTEMHRGDTCLVVDRSRSTDIEDLVRAGETPRELRVLRENGTISVGTPMPYDRMRHKRSGDGRAALAASVVVFTMAAVTTAIVAMTFAPVRRVVGHLRASAQSARAARPRSRTARLLWGRGSDADPD